MLGLFKQLIIDWCLSKRTISAEKFHALNNPVSVQIPDVNGDLKFVEQTNVNNYLVETDIGFSEIKHSFKTVKYERYNLQLENGLTLDAADNHIVITSTGEEIFVKDLQVGKTVLATKFGPSTVKSVANTHILENMYDLELNDSRHLFYTNGILSHNTTVVAMYILWMTCFQADKLCIIASKAMNHATEIMSRIKFAYEELPNWLKPGCRYYSRTSIEFDNGSKIKSEATSEKTGRGSSPAFLMVDEIAFLRRTVQDEMWASLAPSLSTGGKFVLTSTPNGDSDLFAALWRGAMSGTNSFYPIKAMWYQHPDRGEKYYKEMQGKLGELKTLQELDCQFLSSEALLINSIKLSQIRTKSPVSESMGFRFWTDEIGGAGKMYLVGVDPATGNGNDFTVIQAFEFPSLIQIAELRLNNVNIPLIYAKIKWLLRHLRTPGKDGKRSEVIWSFERNGIGEAIVALIQNDDSRDGGIYLDGVELYNENVNRLGVYTTGKSKLVSCMQLKGLIEKVTGGITVNSDILHFELKNFIATGGTYQAKNGCTDDAVTSTLVVMKLLNYLSSYDDKARSLVYETVSPDNDITSDSFGDEPVPFSIL